MRCMHEGDETSLFIVFQTQSPHLWVENTQFHRTLAFFFLCTRWMAAKYIYNFLWNSKKTMLITTVYFHGFFFIISVWLALQAIHPETIHPVVTLENRPIVVDWEIDHAQLRCFNRQSRRSAIAQSWCSQLVQVVLIRCSDAVFPHRQQTTQPPNGWGTSSTGKSNGQIN